METLPATIQQEREQIRILPMILQNRSRFSTADDLIHFVYTHYEGRFDKEEIGELVVLVEQSILDNYRPRTVLDFHQELNAHYENLEEIITMLRNRKDHLIEPTEKNGDSYEGIRVLLSAIKVGKDYLSLILQAQKEMFNQQKVQEFMDLVLEIVGDVDPALKAKILDRVLNQDE